MAQPRTVENVETGFDSREFPDLAELCRVYDIGLELIERCDDLETLLDLVLDEYERRLAELPDEALDARAGEGVRKGSQRKLRALVMFASQASALKQKAVAAGEIRRRAAALEEANRKLAEALEEAQGSNARLDAVLEAAPTGILIASHDGSIRRANRAAAELIGAEGPEACEGRAIPAFLDGARPGADSEIAFQDPAGERRVVLVARRRLANGDEVMALGDVTRRYAEIEERHRLEKLSEILKTLSVLSHKINNPLTALLGRAQILRARQGTDPSVVKAAEVIEDSAVRIADLIRELARVVKEGRQEAVDRILDMGPTGTTAEGGGR